MFRPSSGTYSILDKNCVKYNSNTSSALESYFKFTWVTRVVTMLGRIISSREDPPIRFFFNLKDSGAWKELDRRTFSTSFLSLNTSVETPVLVTSFFKYETNTGAVFIVVVVSSTEKAESVDIPWSYVTIVRFFVAITM